MSKIKIPRSRADVIWKEVLEVFLEEVMAFVFPRVYSLIDWSKKWDFLDKELQAISYKDTQKTRFLDKLIRVHLKEGQEAWLLIHIEIQGHVDVNFAKRMFVYHYRIFDKFGFHPMSCAILIDSSIAWRPSIYEHHRFDNKLTFEFPIFKLLEWESQRDVLENSKSPFACVLLAQLDAIKLKNKPLRALFETKLSITKALYKKGFSADIIRKLFCFIDGIIRLTNELELKFETMIRYFEEKKKVAYISSIERIGLKRGREQGLIEGVQQRSQEIAIRMLKKNQSLEFISEMTGLSEDELLMLSK